MNIQYRTKSVQEDNALQKLAEAYGWKLDVYREHHQEDFPVMRLDFDTKEYRYYDPITTQEDMTLEDFVVELQKIAPLTFLEVKLNPVKGEQNSAILNFFSQEVQVGCHTFPFSDVKALYEAIQDGLSVSR